jgi:arginine N-succinyltransferase
MFRIRQSYREDVEQVLAVAEHLDTVNLPAEQGHIENILERSERSFAAAVPPPEREYLFVLEDLAKRRIIGTSMIYAQHGTRRAPHIFFRVENDERYSMTLDKHFVHQTLRIGYNYDGPTEIGGLIVLPEYRRTAEALGKTLSYVRFLFIRMHRSVFRPKVLSELLPPLEPDGQSRLWEALGRKFTGLSYQEADLLSKDNKEFIHALFPDDPIHTELLPDDVRSMIGQVGPDTKAVEAMLRRIGFDYAGQIDPFDGGPHFMARTDDITLVRDAQQVAVRTVDVADGERPWAVLAVELEDQRPRFRAIGSRAIPLGHGELGIPDDARRRLGVADGHRVWVTFG